MTEPQTSYHIPDEWDEVVKHLDSIPRDELLRMLAQAERQRYQWSILAQQLYNQTARAQAIVEAALYHRHCTPEQMGMATYALWEAVAAYEAAPPDDEDLAQEEGLPQWAAAQTAPATAPRLPRPRRWWQRSDTSGVKPG